MKFKLDENVDLKILSQFRLAGYDVATVPEQDLASAPNTELNRNLPPRGTLFCRCRSWSKQSRTLQPCQLSWHRRSSSAHSNSFGGLDTVIDTLIFGLESASISGKLWVIRTSSIQEYQPIEPEEGENE